MRYHGEEVADPVGPRLAAGSGGPVVQHARHGKSEVSAEKVDEDRVARVHRSDVASTNHLVDVEEDDLDAGHDDELDRTGGAEDDSEGDEDRRHREVCAEQRAKVYIDPRPVRVAKLVVMDLEVNSEQLR